MVDKKILEQYPDLIEEQKEVERKKAKLEKELEKIIEEGSVKDCVKGGNGGIQTFHIQGFPIREYDKKANMLEKRIKQAILLEEKIQEQIEDIEEFVISIDNSRIRRIFEMHYVNRMTWDEVAIQLAGRNNTKDSVRMEFQRFLQSKEKVNS